MTPDTVIALAREAGAHISSFHGRFVMYADDLERFASLVAAAEREECAKVCEQIDTAAIGGDRPAPNDCAAAIRSRTNKNA